MGNTQPVWRLRYFKMCHSYHLLMQVRCLVWGKSKLVSLTGMNEVDIGCALRLEGMLSFVQ